MSTIQPKQTPMIGHAMNNANITTKIMMETMIEWWDEMHDESLNWLSSFNVNDHIDDDHAFNGYHGVDQCKYIHAFMHHLTNGDVAIDCDIINGVPNGYKPIDPQMAHYVWGQLVNSIIGMDDITTNCIDCVGDGDCDHNELAIMNLMAIALKHGGVCIKQ